MALNLAGVSPLLVCVTLLTCSLVSMCLEAVHVFDWRLSICLTGGCGGHSGGRASATGRGFSCL